jgi:hypothetical protein
MEDSDGRQHIVETVLFLYWHVRDADLPRLQLTPRAASLKPNLGAYVVNAGSALNLTTT